MVKELQEQLQDSKVAKVLQFSLSGMSQRAIAKETGYSLSDVRDIINNAQTAITQEMLDVSENIQIKNMARLEYLLSRIWPFATGEKFDSGLPEQRMVDSAMKIIKMQLEWSKEVENKKASMAKQGELQEQLEIVQSTFTASDDLFTIAQVNKSVEDAEFTDVKDNPYNSLYESKIEELENASSTPQDAKDIEKSMSKSFDELLNEYKKDMDSDG